MPQPEDDSLEAVVDTAGSSNQALAALRESEQKYRELVMLANSIILRWSRDGRITFLNEFGQRFFGYTESEILGTGRYPLAVKFSDQQMAAVKICPAEFLGEWNYTIKPLSAPTQPNPCVNEKDLLEWFDCRCRLIRDAAGHRLNTANGMAAAIAW